MAGLFLLSWNTFFRFFPTSVQLIPGFFFLSFFSIGIVYCFSRKETEEVAVDLMSRGIKAGCYHADMDAKARSQVHRDWLSGVVQVAHIAL